MRWNCGGGCFQQYHSYDKSYCEEVCLFTRNFVRDVVCYKINRMWKNSHDSEIKKQPVFFKEEFHENIIFICNSWLLYPWNREVLKNGSNLAQFYDDFTIVSSGEYQNYSEAWRLFDCLYDGNPDNLPADTSLRRAYIERIKNGQPIGHGTGVIVFDKLKTR